MERLSRIFGAALLGIGGAIHLALWRSGYRDIRYIGLWFLANALVSAVLVVAAVVGPNPGSALFGAGFSLASLAALVMSRTTGLAGFREVVWSGSAIRATAAEIGATVAMALAVVLHYSTERALGRHVRPLTVGHRAARNRATARSGS